MKTIKVFIAADEELLVERGEIDMMLTHLNKVLRPRGIEIEPEDDLDGYSQTLKACELCLVLYWNRFGEYRKAQLDEAYQSLKAGSNPQKLYVYFKDSDSIDPELKDFKEQFVNQYGHFFCRFENVDTMRFNFLMQFEDYANANHIQELVEVKGTHLRVNGEDYVDMRKVPCAGNSKDYQDLMVDIADLQDEVSELEQEGDDSDKLRRKRQKLHDKKECLEEMERNIVATKRQIMQFSWWDRGLAPVP